MIQLNSDTYLPGVSLRFHRWRTQPYKTAPSPISDANCKPRLLSVLLINQLQAGGSHTPSLGSINLRKQLAEFRKPVFSLDYWFVIKGCNSGTGRWKRCLRQGMGKERIPCPRSELLPLNLHIFSNLETLWTLSFWVFREASLYYVLFWLECPVISLKEISLLPLPPSAYGPGELTPLQLREGVCDPSLANQNAAPSLCTLPLESWGAREPNKASKTTFWDWLEVKEIEKMGWKPRAAVSYLDSTRKRTYQEQSQYREKHSWIGKEGHWLCHLNPWIQPCLKPMPVLLSDLSY